MPSHSLVGERVADTVDEPRGPPLPFFEYLPQRADHLLGLAQRHVMPLVRARIPLARLHGRTAADGGFGTVLVAGEAPNLDSLVAPFFSGPLESEPLGWATPVTLATKLARLGAADDLVLARVAQPIARMTFGAGYLHIPSFVDAWLRVRHPDEMLARASETLRRNIRDVRRSAFRWRRSRDPADFERFYDDFYRPYISRRFGEFGIVRDRATLRRRFRFGNILWLDHGKRTVLGELNEEHGRDLRLLSIGVAPGAVDPHGTGAFTALKLAAIEFAHQRGFRRVNLGGSLPSLTNGVLANKISWGGRLRDRRDSHQDILLRWPVWSDRVACYLADVAPIIRDGSRLSALTCIEGGAPTDPAEATRAWRRLKPRGLHRLYIVAAGGWERLHNAPRPVPAGRLFLAEPGTVPELLTRARRYA